MEKFCSKLLGIMKLEITNYMIIAVLCIIAIVVCVFLRDDKESKILLWVSSACLIIICALFANTFIPIYSDYCNKSFVQLEDVTVMSTSGFDLSGTGELSIYTKEGKVITLTTVDQLPDGEYKASVVYTERSNYLIDWKPVE